MKKRIEEGKQFVGHGCWLYDSPGFQQKIARRLTYKFMELPHVLKLQAIEKCHLGKKNDDKLEDLVRWTEIFKRAKEAGKVRILWEEVCRLEDEFK
jgi:hypothetical protein